MMFKEFLRFNGDVILKNLKLIPLNLDDPLMIFNSNNESYLVIDSRSSSFSQAQQESFKEKLHLSFCKNESEAALLKFLYIFRQRRLDGFHKKFT